MAGAGHRASWPPEQVSTRKDAFGSGCCALVLVSPCQRERNERISVLDTPNESHSPRLAFSSVVSHRGTLSSFQRQLHCVTHCSHLVLHAVCAPPPVPLSSSGPLCVDAASRRGGVAFPSHLSKLSVCRCSVPEGRGSLVISTRRRREGGSPHATTGGSQSTGELTTRGEPPISHTRGGDPAGSLLSPQHKSGHAGRD